jgi:hypothetical protein
VQLALLLGEVECMLGGIPAIAGFHGAAISAGCDDPAAATEASASVAKPWDEDPAISSGFL